MRRQCACTFRQREPLIWTGNDDHVSILRGLSDQLVGYVTAFPTVNGVKKLEWHWCGLLPQSRWLKHRPQTSQQCSAFVLLEVRVRVTCLYCAGEDGESTAVQRSSRKHILVLLMVEQCFSLYLCGWGWEDYCRLVLRDRCSLYVLFSKLENFLSTKGFRYEMVVLGSTAGVFSCVHLYKLLNSGTKIVSHFFSHFLCWFLCERGKNEPEFDHLLISPHPNQVEGALQKADEAAKHHFCSIVSWVKMGIPSYILSITALKSACCRGQCTCLLWWLLTNFKSFWFILLPLTWESKHPKNIFTSLSWNLLWFLQSAADVILEAICCFSQWRVF